MIRVRFAPSPTGFLHIGGARTALFNWMYARSQGGKFILRIEDTDRERSKEEYLTEILDSLQWLGLSWDELYKQSDRFPLYREYAEKLVGEGKAYLDGSAIIFHKPQQEIKLFDLIRGEIQFDTEILKDEVLIKSDGSPTYSFACVVDDALMEISHVIRGEDHISNTPKQIMIYQALGLKIPKFAHLPLIMDEEGGRMSKRTGAVAVTEYRKEGFLPDALVNYLMLLGWSPGENQEIVRLDAAVKKFSIKKINKAGAAFSLDKLKWLNAQYIKQEEEDRLADLLWPMLLAQGYIDEKYDRNKLKAIIRLYKSRMATLAEFLERADYLFIDEMRFEEEARAQYLTTPRKREFGLLADRLAALDNFEAQRVEEVFRAVAQELGGTAADLVHPVRVALTGKAVGIGLFDTMALLGREKVVERLRKTFS